MYTFVKNSYFENFQLCSWVVLKKLRKDFPIQIKNNKVEKENLEVVQGQLGIRIYVPISLEGTTAPAAALRICIF